jgi:hypothetical protein
MSTEAESKNEKTKIVFFNENENNLKNVVTNITVTATAADRTLASAISLFDNKSYVPLTGVEMKELDDELEKEDSEHLSQVKEIKQYAKDIDKVFVKPQEGASKFDKYSLNADVHADIQRYTIALAIASDQYKKVPENARPKQGDNSKSFSQLSRQQKVVLFKQVHQEASSFLYNEIIKRVDQSLRQTLPSDGWAALLELENLRTPAKLQQIANILSSTMNADGNNALGDARILRSLMNTAEQSVPELSTITGLDFVRIFCADQILRNGLKRDPAGLTAKVLEMYNLKLDGINFEEMAKEISKFEKTRTYLGIASSDAKGYFTDRSGAPREQREQRDQNRNKKPRMPRDEFLKMIENYKNSIEEQSKLNPPPTMAEAHDTANHAKGSIIACGIRPQPFNKYKKSRNYDFQWSPRLKNFAWSKGEVQKNDKQSYDDLKKQLDKMSEQHANLATSLENSGVIERDGEQKN